MSHTPEPWVAVFRTMEAIQIRADHERIALVDTCGGDGQSNASRIVACVNACAGIPDNVLEKAAECAASGRFGTMAAMYKAQRDELLAALQMALADHMTEPYLHPLRDGTVEAIRCAIANAENPPCA